MLSLISALHLAAAGGGTSGFGGGGGGGGGFGGGGGGGGGFYIGGGSGGGSAIGFLIIFGLIGAFILFSALVPHMTAMRMRRERQQRDRRVRLAAAEAADDDPAFAVERVIDGGSALFGAIQQAWDQRDDAALSRMVGDDLLVEWRRRLADFDHRGWHNRVRVVSGPTIHYIGIVNRPDDADDRCTIHVDAQLEDFVEGPSGMRILHRGDGDTVTTLSEYWTLGKRDGRWILLSIEQDREGMHNLTSAIIASPWGDDQRLQDSSLIEGAVADAALPGVATAELVDVDLATDARVQALDLALVDARFGPDVLEVAARRAADGWAEAVDGSDAPLEAVASADAVQALLYGTDTARATRLVVRGPAVEHVTIERITPQPEPAQMTLTVSLRGRRYVENRDTAAVISGSQDREIRWTERWTMALDGTDETPWRLVGVGSV